MDDIRTAFERLLGASQLHSLIAKLGFNSSSDPLSDWERLAIWIYTTASNHHERINGTLWSGVLHEDIGEIVKCLRSAIDKLATFRGPVYRGVYIPGFADQVQTKYSIGRIVIWPSFTSTTTQRDRMYPGNVRFLIASRSGRLLGYYSSSMEDAEVLFPPGTPFRVRAWIAEGEVVSLNLEEVI